MQGNNDCMRTYWFSKILIVLILRKKKIMVKKCNVDNKMIFIREVSHWETLTGGGGRRWRLNKDANVLGRLFKDIIKVFKRRQLLASKFLYIFSFIMRPDF